MKTNKLFLTLILLVSISTLPMFAQTKAYEVPLSGNAYLTSDNHGAIIGNNGVARWRSVESEISTYIYFHQPQTIKLSIKGKASDNATIRVLFNGIEKDINLSEGSFETLLGDYSVNEIGYLPISLKGISKEGGNFGEIESYIVETDGELTYVGDFSHYWGRRGPSVHLKYDMPNEDVEWFYNEVTVPEGDDVIGSYYMSNGFGEGYFGMQCNSEVERRVLFSVWSPFDTQDPKLIPEHQRIKLLRQGEGVHIGEFGNEGSGGQSYLKYDWKAGNTYKFLTQIKPDGEGNTIYTAYFFATDENRWRLIASFLRPETDTYYKGAHSFLENFLPNQGYLTRKVLFSNQWSKTVSGEWVPSTVAKFTYDNTAHQKARLDYQGGYIEDANSFYLQNCGFFNESTAYGTEFEKDSVTVEPQINFDELEKL